MPELFNLGLADQSVRGQMGHDQYHIINQERWAPLHRRSSLHFGLFDGFIAHTNNDAVGPDHARSRRAWSGLELIPETTIL